jgi:hypothetical protein
MSFTPTERRWLRYGLPCPLHWSMALAYSSLLIGRPLSYDDAIEILGYNPAVDHLDLRAWIDRRPS